MNTGSQFSSPSSLIQNSMKANVARFQGKVRLIVRHVREMVLKGRDERADDRSNQLRLFTGGYRSVSSKHDEDHLVKCLMTGLPKSTQIVLGHPGFSLTDLLFLPRLATAARSEHSVYLDAFQYAPDESYEWKLFVGSATSEYGSLQRWSSY